MNLAGLHLPGNNYGEALETALRARLQAGDAAHASAHTSQPPATPSEPRP